MILLNLDFSLKAAFELNGDPFITDVPISAGFNFRLEAYGISTVQSAGLP